MDRMTLGEQLHNAAITAEVAKDARSTRDEFRALDARIAELEAMIRRLVDDAHRMHMIGPGYRDQAQMMLYAEAKKLIGR